MRAHAHFRAQGRAQPRRQLSAAGISRRPRARPGDFRHAVPRLSESRRRRAVAPARRSGAQGDLRRDRAHDRSRRCDPGRLVGSQCRRPQAAGDPRRCLRGADRRGLSRRRLQGRRGAGRAAVAGAHAGNGAAAARSQNRAAGMGAGARLADAGLSRSGALRPRPRSGIPRRRAASRLRARRGHGTLQARRRTGRRRRHADARGRARPHGAMAEPPDAAPPAAASWR